MFPTFAPQQSFHHSTRTAKLRDRLVLCIDFHTYSTECSQGSLYFLAHLVPSLLVAQFRRLTGFRNGLAAMSPSNTVQIVTAYTTAKVGDTLQSW